MCLYTTLNPIQETCAINATTVNCEEITNFTAPIRQHDELDYTDHTDQEYICPGISRSSGGKR